MPWVLTYGKIRDTFINLHTEQAFELLSSNPGHDLFDILMHDRRGSAHHPAVFRTSSDLCPDRCGPGTGPYLIKALRLADIAQALLPVFLLKPVARIDLAIGINKKVCRPGFAGEYAFFTVDKSYQAQVKHGPEP